MGKEGVAKPFAVRKLCYTSLVVNVHVCVYFLSLVVVPFVVFGDLDSRPYIVQIFNIWCEGTVHRKKEKSTRHLLFLSPRHGGGVY